VVAVERVSDLPVGGHVPQPHRVIALPPASVLPSGLNATDKTVSAWP
jgi:hypothetical protein